MTKSRDKKLEDLRSRIDKVDARIVRLLGERAGIVVQVGKVKRTTGMPVRDPKRESEVIRRIQAMNRGPFSRKALAQIYSLIIAECSRIQSKGRKV